MKRNIRLEEISDGRLYTEKDMARLGCGGCRGCSVCCRGMGQSITLDPLDVCRLTGWLGAQFDELLESCLELNVVDGLILPNLRMAGPQEACVFLNEEGRCAVHPARPSICRLFPLGRLFEKGDFFYFLQIHECQKRDRTKVKIEKWLDTPRVDANHAYILAWHGLQDAFRARISASGRQEAARECCLILLKLFFQAPYGSQEDFYEEFARRERQARALLEEVKF